MKLLTPLTLSFLLSLSTSTSVITNTNPTLTATASQSDLSSTSTIISDTASPISETPYTYPPSTLYPTTLRTTSSSSRSTTSSSLSTTRKTTTRTTTRTTTPISSQNSTTTQPGVPPTNFPFCAEAESRCYCKPGSNGTFCGDDGHLQGPENGGAGCNPDTAYYCHLKAHDDEDQKPWIVNGEWCKDKLCFGKCIGNTAPADQPGNAACNHTVPPVWL